MIIFNDKNGIYTLGEIPLEIYMWRREKALKDIVRNADITILENIDALSAIEIMKDGYLKGHMMPVVYNVKSGLNVKRIKEIEKEYPECGKSLLDLLHYDNIVSVQKASKTAADILRQEAEDGLIKCPKSKECNKDPNVCYMEKYAQVNNTTEEIKKRYDLEEGVIDGIKSVMMSAMISCNPNLGSITCCNRVLFDQ